MDRWTDGRTGPNQYGEHKIFFFLDLDSLSICKKYTNTKTSWQIILIRKKNGRGVGEVCVVWASGRGWGGGLVVSEFFDKESNFFFGGGGGAIFYKLIRNPNLTFFFIFIYLFFFFVGGGGS